MHREKKVRVRCVGVHVCLSYLLYYCQCKCPRLYPSQIFGHVVCCTTDYIPMFSWEYPPNFKDTTGENNVNVSKISATTLIQNIQPNATVLKNSQVLNSRYLTKFSSWTEGNTLHFSWHSNRCLKFQAGLPELRQPCVSSSGHSCPPDPPPCVTAGHSSLVADGWAAPPTKAQTERETHTLV